MHVIKLFAFVKFLENFLRFILNIFTFLGPSHHYTSISSQQIFRVLFSLLLIKSILCCPVSLGYFDILPSITSLNSYDSYFSNSCQMYQDLSWCCELELTFPFLCWDFVCLEISQVWCIWSHNFNMDICKWPVLFENYCFLGVINYTGFCNHSDFSSAKISESCGRE